MRDCCSAKSELTCDVLSGFYFVLFVLTLSLFLQILLQRSELRREPTLLALHVTICLALLTRAIFFLNDYFYEESEGYCAYIIFSFAPITLLATGATLFSSYVWYMSQCTAEALARPDGSLYVKK